MSLWLEGLGAVHAMGINVITRLRPALGVLLGACGAQMNPVLSLPEPPGGLFLAGRVVSDSGEPVPAQLQLSALSRQGVADTITAQVGTLGRFHFANLPPGAYELSSRSLGFRPRRDTFALSARPGLEVVLTLQPVSICLDSCLPDTLLVRAALAQQHRWQCDRGSSSTDAARARWAEFLAGEPFRAYLPHQLESAEIARQLRRVRHDADCRRVAAAALATPTTLTFTVFRWGNYWLVSDPDFVEAIMTDRSFQPVAGMSGGGFVYWVAERTPR